VVAMTPDDYQKWIAGSTSGSSLAQNGERLFASLGCNSCHTGGPSPRGPNLAGIYGSRVQMIDGSYITADDAYLRDKILNPSTRLISGYVPIMPTYQGQVSEEGLIDLVEYIKSLNSSYRIQQTLTSADNNPGAAKSSTSGVVPAPLQTSSGEVLAGGSPVRSQEKGRTGAPGMVTK
jgi:cytochrome c oxidase subunit II